MRYNSQYGKFCMHLSEQRSKCHRAADMIAHAATSQPHIAAALVPVLTHIHLNNEKKPNAVSSLLS